MDNTTKKVSDNQIVNVNFTEEGNKAKYHTQLRNTGLYRGTICPILLEEAMF
jgi:hypothetical protein